MKTPQISDRGQILIIFVFVIIGLIAISGLAVDGGNVYADRRNAQNAADAAALASSVVRVNWEKQHKAMCTNFNTADPLLPACSGDMVTTALNSAGDNGYDSLPQHKNRVDVYSPPIDGPYHDCSSPCNPNDYIQVVIHTEIDTYFAKVIGIRQLDNTVQAVALAKYQPAQDLYGGASLVQLDSSGCDAFVLGGNYSVTLNGGGIFVNSNSTCAFSQQTCKTFQLNGTASIKGIGGVDTKCTPPPTMTQVTNPYPFPPAPLIAEPAECGIAGTSTKVKGVTTYHPGHYPEIPSGKLATGVYCVDDVKTQKQDNVDGTAGVLIYVKPTGGFQMDGGTFNLVAATTGSYANLVVYFYPPSRETCKINGGSAQTLTGMVFLPNCDLKVNGNSTPTGITSQIVAATFDMTGTENAVFNGPGGKVPQIPEIDQTGLFH